MGGEMQNKSNKEDGNLPINVKSHYYKSFDYYFQMAKTKCNLVLTILVLVICITFIFYSSLSTDAQIKLLEKALSSVPGKAQKTSIVLEKPLIYRVPEMVQNTSNVLEKAPSSIPEKVQNTSIVLVNAPCSVPEKVQNTSNVLEKPQIIKVPEKVQNNVTKKVEKWPLYFFGDSLYDTGMGFYIERGGAKADSYPYGKTYFKRPAGRFSDGLLIPDFLARFAGFPLPEPYGNFILTEYSNAVNFAGTAAGVLVDGRKDSLNLKLQTDYFVEMVGKMKNQYGKQKTKKLISNAVLVFNIGSNDYVDIWIQNNKPLNPAFVDYFVNKMLGNFTTAITRMYNEGARKFAFQSQAPVGCAPLYLQPDGQCAKDLNDLAKIHNVKFDELAKTWVRQLPGLKYIVYDFYASLSARLRNGAKYGFKETQSACCGSGKFNALFTCMEKVNFTLCDDISSHLFFDPAHTTQHANMQFAQEFWGGPSTLVRPCNIKDFLTNGC